MTAGETKTTLTLSYMTPSYIDQSSVEHELARRSNSFTTSDFPRFARPPRASAAWVWDQEGSAVEVGREDRHRPRRPLSTDRSPRGAGHRRRRRSAGRRADR